uniref:Uncharacterized protein n=1 Tax=Klebsiella pneumoniae TaxID=573 RepID=A0A2P1BNL5_KLEPN|nr:hypothetical protein [Klebsiella pneumoniae]
MIIDEAHNSQTGSTAAKLQAALGMSGQGKMSTMTVDELLEQLQNLGSPGQYQLFRLYRYAEALHFDAVRSPNRPEPASL